MKSIKIYALLLSGLMLLPSYAQEGEKEEITIEIESEGADPIITVNGQRLESEDEINEMLEREKVNLRRSGQNVEIIIKKEGDDPAFGESFSRVFHSRAFLGIKGETDDSGDGVIIREIIAGEAAEKAGLKTGDVILSIDGRDTPEYEELLAVLGEKEPAQEIVLRLRSGGKERDVAVSLGKRAYHFELERMEDMKREMRQDRDKMRADMDKMKIKMQRGYLGISPSEGETGVGIAEVHEDSPAEKAGLTPGDQILALNGQKLRTPDDLMEEMKKTRPAETIELTILRGGKEEKMQIELQARTHPGRIHIVKEVVD